MAPKFKIANVNKRTCVTATSSALQSPPTSPGLAPLPCPSPFPLSLSLSLSPAPLFSLPSTRLCSGLSHHCPRRPTPPRPPPRSRPNRVVGSCRLGWRRYGEGPRRVRRVGGGRANAVPEAATAIAMATMTRSATGSASATQTPKASTAAGKGPVCARSRSFRRALKGKGRVRETLCSREDLTAYLPAELIIKIMGHMTAADVVSSGRGERGGGRPPETDTVRLRLRRPFAGGRVRDVQEVARPGSVRGTDASSVWCGAGGG